MMKRTAMALFAAALLGAACAYTPQAPIRVYDFGLAPAQESTKLSVHVDNIQSPDWLDRPDMLYRPAYRNPQAIEPYAYSRWAGTPAAMLTLRMRQAFGSTTAAEARCRLRVGLQEFSQIFSSDSESRAVLQIAAVLNERGGEKRLQSLQLRLERVADTADAAGGASAFARLADELTAKLRDWAAEVGYCG